MKTSLSRLIDFLFLHLSLEVASGMAALYCGAHWMFWRTFDLPPYRVLCKVATLAHLPGEFLWGAPLSILGLAQIVGAWRGDLKQRQVISRALAMLMVMIAVIMMATLARSIVAWFILWGAVVQLSVFFQLPGAVAAENGKLRCVMPPIPMLIGDGGYDKQTTFIVGAAVIFMVSAIPTIKLVVDWIRGKSDAQPQPFLVAPAPVFATMEVVTKVDQGLKADLAKLDKYVHDSIHSQGKEIQGVAFLVKASEESQRDGIEDVNRQGEVRITKVHDRLNEMDRTIGGLGADTKHATAQLTEVQRTLNILLSRTAPTQRRGGGATE